MKGLKASEHTLLDRKNTVKLSSEKIYRKLMNPKIHSSFFPNTFLSTDDEEKIPSHFEFVVRITKMVPHSHIHGFFMSTKKDDKFGVALFDFFFKKTDDPERTEIRYRIYKTLD